ncbi:hypothetical protein MKK84_24745 [Methylobacterium sp. E-065]|uniref:hypothetical protein n=1 Tax=Methylobacterium sp. E-065 TaxID=2836583 RepID=UPI001FB92DA5|nr:hypothetical protein [Methylobacterium sp. E-065]MCJ2020598.1 hypothetical protein [Methylobacterium sp. E-065]
MSVEASLVRIEQQNALIAEVLTGVFKTQNTHSDMLKTLAAAAPEAIDTTTLDASIAATDAVLAKLAPATADGTAAATASAQQPDPASGTAAASAEPAAQPAQQPDAPAGAATTAA